MGHTVLLAPLHRMQGTNRTVHKGFPPEERFGIVDRATKALIGEVNYCNYMPLRGEAEIGIEIDYTERGRGFGEDALYHFLDYLFFTMGLRRVRLAVVHGNHPAHRLYAKLGFSDCERIRAGGYDVEQEELVDVITMVLERTEWQSRRKEYVFKQ